MPSRDKICCKKIVKRDNGIIVAEVEMTKDTKYLDDKNKDGDSILTEDMLKRLDESYERVKKRLTNPNYKPSRAVQRMHAIWQMDSEYLDEQLEKQRLTISMNSAKNGEKINKFCFNYQIWHSRSSICDKRVLSHFLLGKISWSCIGRFYGL